MNNTPLTHLTDTEIVHHIVEHLIKKGANISVHDLKYLIEFSKELETTVQNRMTARGK